MSARKPRSLERRVAMAAEETLGDRQYVCAIDVIVGLGWLSPRTVDAWRRGQLASLEDAMQVAPDRLAKALELVRDWAQDRGLHASEATYLARTRERRALRFSRSGDRDVEGAYRTHWLAPELSEEERARIVERESPPPELVAISPLNAWSCRGCGETGDLLVMEEPGPMCLSCVEMDHLLFLPAGNAALTRRARKASGLSAVVVRFSRSRRRYERQGILVEEHALDRAEAECLADQEVRARRRARADERRAVADTEWAAEAAAAILRQFPGCPAARAQAIAHHAGARGSGRVGRSARGRALDEEALALAVAASVRHEDTDYDALLMAGVDRRTARERARDAVERVMDGWRAVRA